MFTFNPNNNKPRWTKTNTLSKGVGGWVQKECELRRKTTKMFKHIENLSSQYMYIVEQCKARAIICWLPRRLVCHLCVQLPHAEFESREYWHVHWENTGIFTYYYLHILIEECKDIYTFPIEENKTPINIKMQNNTTFN